MVNSTVGGVANASQVLQYGQLERIITLTTLIVNDTREHRALSVVSRIGKLVFVATSLAPVCGAFAIIRISDLGILQSLCDFYVWMWIAVGLALLAGAYRFLNWCQKNIKHTNVETLTVKPTDKDVLAFLMAYLLPLLGNDAIAFGKPILSFYVYALIFLAIYHSNSFHFNPMLSMLGWHFYEIQTKPGYSAILLSTTNHPMQIDDIVVVRLTPFLLLAVEESHRHETQHQGGE